LRGSGKGQHIETHDFAMAILQREITFTDSIRPICIPRQNMDFSGRKAIAAGWGRYKKKVEGDPSTERQSLTLRDVELSVSTKRYSHYKMFGTKGTNDKGEVADACSGDSGGPLIWQSKAPRFVLIGTVQGTGFNCKTGEYNQFEGSDNGVWNKVSAHSDWIKKAMKDNGGMGETESEEDEGVVSGEVETEDDYFRAMRKYKKEIKKKVLAEVEKEAKKDKKEEKGRRSERNQEIFEREGKRKQRLIGGEGCHDRGGGDRR